MGILTSVVDGRVNLLQIDGTGTLVARVNGTLLGVAAVGAPLEGQGSTVVDGNDTRVALLAIVAAGHGV